MEDLDAVLFSAGVRLAGEQSTGALVTGLREAGVEPIVLKGPATTEWLRPQGGDRHSTDIDLLVAPQQRDIADRELRTLGYEPLLTDDPRGHARVWVRQSEFSVDLHRRFVGVEVDDDTAWLVLSSSTENVRIGGVDCLVLDRIGRTTHVVLHAAQHGPRDPRVVDDLRLLLDRTSEADWRAATDLAAALGALSAFTAGLTLDERGSALATHLGLPSVASTEAALRSGGAPETALGFERLVRTRGVRAKAALVGRELFPHPSFMRVWHPLARRGPAGLAAAYALRPLWLLRRFRGAVKAVRRARRTAVSGARGASRGEPD